MKSKIVLWFCLVPGIGTALLIGGVVEEDPEPLEPEIPLQEIHKEVTRKFINAMGFGISRMKVFQNRKTGSTRNHQLTYFIEGDESYKVNLIGLVANPKGNVYTSAAEQKEGSAKKSQQDLHLELNKLLPKTTPPTALDHRAITLFTENREAKPQLLQTNEKWIGHGPIRATAAKCIKCHGVEKGTLLGVFRYEFIDPKK